MQLLSSELWAPIGFPPIFMRCVTSMGWIESPTWVPTRCWKLVVPGVWDGGDVNRGSKTSPYSTLELCGAWGLGWGRTIQTRRTTTWSFYHCLLYYRGRVLATPLWCAHDLSEEIGDTCPASHTVCPSHSPSTQFWRQCKARKANCEVLEDSKDLQR
jgi:hypothetical protein